MALPALRTSPSRAGIPSPPSIVAMDCGTSCKAAPTGGSSERGRKELRFPSRCRSLPRGTEPPLRMNPGGSDLRGRDDAISSVALRSPRLAATTSPVSQPCLPAKRRTVSCIRVRSRMTTLFDGRPALRPGRVRMGNPTRLAGSCCSLDAARRSSGFAAGNAAAAFRTSSLSLQRATTPWSSPSPFLPTPEGAGFPVAIPVKAMAGQRSGGGRLRRLRAR